MISKMSLQNRGR